MSARLRSAAGRLVAALALLASLAPGGARALSLGSASVDFVRVAGGGRHEVLVSVLDPDGQPVSRLEQSFAVQLDGRAAGAVTATALRQRCPGGTLTLVVDAGLLRGESLAAVQDALRALGRALPPGDRLRVVAAGRRPRSTDATAGHVEGLASAIAGFGDDAPPLLYDALFDAARAQSRRGERDAGAILLVTRGADGGSARRSLDVLALARTQARLTPVTVVFVGDEGGAAEADRLHRLAEHTAGAVANAAAPEELAATLPGLAARTYGRWVLEFAAPGWDAHAPRHAVEVVVEALGERRQAALEYVTADVLPPPWWRSAWVWLVPLLLVAIAGAAIAFGRPKQLFLLVHDGGDEDGNWYEFFGLPATVGAAAGNDLVFADPQVSRNHAVLERRGRTVELVDLNSENGTFVNGDRVSRRALADGDQVSFGPDVHLVYEARS